MTQRYINSAHKKQGFSLVEVMLTSVLFALIVTAFSGSYLYGTQSTALATSRAQAAFIAEEGMEAVRNIRDSGFTNLTTGTHGLSHNSGQWEFSGTSDATGMFTRNVTITDEDAYRKKVVVTVAWQQNIQRTGLISLESEFTNWERSVSAPPNAFSIDISTANLSTGGTVVQGIKIQNTTETDLTIDTITLTWDNGNLIEFIDISGTEVWAFNGAGDPNGRQSSGTVLDIEDYLITQSMGQVPINGFEFNGDMTGATVTMIFTMTTGESYQTTVSFTAPEPPPTPDWVLPALNGIYNTPDAAPGVDAIVFGNTAYFVTEGAGNDFYTIDVTDHANLSLLSSVSLGVGTSGLDISGSNAYVSSHEDNQELQVIDLISATQTGSYDKSGNADANDVRISGNTAYLVTNTVGGNPGYEFYSIDVSTPSAPSLIGGLNIGDSINAIDISGNYAYLVTADDTAELQIVDISLPYSPAIISTLNLPDRADATAIHVSGNYAYVGRAKTSGGNGELYIIDISNVSAPTVLNGVGYELNTNVNDVFAYGTNVFLATSDSSKEFQVIGISDPTTLTLTGTLNLAGIATSVYVSDNSAFVTTENRNQEFIVIEPN